MLDVDSVHIGGRHPMLKRLWKTDAPLTATGLMMLPVLAILAVGVIVDPRLITGAPAWLKPAKFALSIAVYVFTLAWIFTFIPGFEKTRRIVGWVTAIVMVLELSIISVQACSRHDQPLQCLDYPECRIVHGHGNGDRAAD